MKPLQYDDVWDDHKQPKKKWKWQHVNTGYIVRDENKKQAIINLFNEYSMQTRKKNVIILP